MAPVAKAVGAILMPARESLHERVQRRAGPFDTAGVRDR
jgi:hypothetical protein